MTETQLRQPFIAALRKIGALVVPYVGSKMGQIGVADVFIAHKDWHGWVEFKGPTTKVQPLQQKFLDDMRKRNVNALLVRLLTKSTFRIVPGPIYSWRTGDDILKALKEI